MKKSTLFLTGMAALLLSFGLILTGCGDSETGDPSTPGGDQKNAFVIIIDGLTGYAGEVVGITYAMGNNSPNLAVGHLPREATITADGKATVSFSTGYQDEEEVFICIDGNDNSWKSGVAGTVPEIGAGSGSSFGDYSITKVVFGAKTVTLTYPTDFVTTPPQYY